MPFVDAHVHVWTDDLAAYPLAPGFTAADMSPAAFTAEDLLTHCRPSGVDRVVLIQMSYYGFDNSYTLDTIARYPGTFRGVAIVDHTRPDLGEELQRLRAGGVRGLRVYQLHEAPTIPLDAPEYRDLCGLACDLGLAICPLTEPEYLSGIARVADRHPGLTLVIDHLARIGCGKPINGAHADALCDLAQYRNCCVKVSAFYALGAAKPPHDDLVLLIRRVHDAFGAARLMWASDSPFQVVHETYEDSISLVRDRLDFLTDAGRDAMLRGTAERVFFSD